MIKPISLFKSVRERLIAALLLLLLAAATLGYHYFHYRKLLAQKYFYTTALVLEQSRKGTRTILKLQTPHFHCYTSTKEDLADLRDRSVEVMLIRPRRPISFTDYLRGFYTPSVILRVLPKERRYRLKELIAAQHEDPFAKELFGALFLATSLSKELRSKLASLGLAHLVALSGFHLGIIMAVVGGVLGVLSKPLWEHCCPYRNLYLFVGSVGLGVSGLYLLFVGVVPSLVRAFVLSSAIFLLFWRHVKLVSFELLFWVVALLLALWPHFLFRIGFWFSVAGVFFIYLFFHHLRSVSRWRGILLFHFWVYMLMLPIVHVVFDPFSWWQLLSPLISLLFVAFYPLAFLLHLLGIGGWLDGVVAMMHSDIAPISVHTPLWVLVAFIALLLLSIPFRRFLFFALLLEIGWFVYEVA